MLQGTLLSEKDCGAVITFVSPTAVGFVHLFVSFLRQGLAMWPNCLIACYVDQASLTKIRLLLHLVC